VKTTTTNNGIHVHTIYYIRNDFAAGAIDAKTFYYIRLEPDAFSLWPPMVLNFNLSTNLPRVG
jgi:hypothetical protein